MKNPVVHEYYQELHQELFKQEGLEAKLLFLRRYKQDRVADIESSLFSEQAPLEIVMADLTYLADAMLINAYELAREELSHVFGLPRCKDNDGNFIPSEFAIIGMGKLGGLELHLNSDLDLIFVYSRNGETQGRRSITNKEYFAKLAQRIISYLGLPTHLGYAYKVDTELRPSGNAGTLVTSLDSWVTYYHEHAAPWEHQALLRARLIHAGDDFGKAFDGLFQRLVFLKPFPENFSEEIHRLRIRIEKELAKETPRRWHYKKGTGGLLDIEFTVQFLQLKLGKVFEDLFTPNTLDAIGRLQQRQILPDSELRVLRESYDFYRMMEIYLEARYDLKEGYLDLEHECVPDLARQMSFPDKQAFVAAFSTYRRKVREIYLKTLKVKEG